MTHYEVLGIPESATTEEIRAAWLRIAKQCHPDVGAGADPERYKRANAAQQILSNPDTRYMYDLGVHQAPFESQPKQNGNSEDGVTLQDVVRLCVDQAAAKIASQNPFAGTIYKKFRPEILEQIGNVCTNVVRSKMGRNRSAA